MIKERFTKEKDIFTEIQIDISHPIGVMS